MAFVCIILSLLLLYSAVVALLKVTIWSLNKYSEDDRRKVREIQERYSIKQ